MIESWTVRVIHLCGMALLIFVVLEYDGTNAMEYSFFFGLLQHTKQNY